MSDTLLHCFACDAFQPQEGETLVCSACGSDFVEIVQVERSPMAASAARPSTGASQTSSETGQQPAGGIPGMLSNLLSSILPTGLMNEEEGNNQSDRQTQGQPQDSSTTDADRPQTAPETQRAPPDFLTQMFRQFPQGRSTPSPLGGSSFSRTTHGPGGSSFTFAFGSSSMSQPVLFGSQGHRNASMHHNPFGMPMAFGATDDGIPQVQNLPDLAAFLAQALGAVPGRAGDYASNETFDNIISELMNRNPQSNVQAASERAMAQIRRFQVTEGAAGLEGSKLGEECSICQEDYKIDDVLVDLRCHHVYHEECLLSWVKTNGVCPICRAPVLEFEETPEQDTLD